LLAVGFIKSRVNFKFKQMGFFNKILVHETKTGNLIDITNLDEKHYESFLDAMQKLQVAYIVAKEKKSKTKEEAAIVGNTLLAAVAHQKIDLIKEYLDPTGVTITELIDRNALFSLCQLLDAYLLEAVRNSR
jgi:hypothetical protein